MNEERRKILSEVKFDPLALNNLNNLNNSNSLKSIMESMKELELPSGLNKKIYWWSEKGAELSGYCKAMTKDGQTIKYTAFTEKEDDYKWDDKVMLGKFSQAEISFSRSFMKDIEDLKCGTVSKPPKQK